MARIHRRSALALAALGTVGSVAIHAGPALASRQAPNIPATPKLQTPAPAGYWTPHRLAAARPLLDQPDTHVHPRLRSIPNGPAGGSGAARPTASIAYANGWATRANGRYDARVGKLYFTEPNGKPYQCSGSVVGRDLVLTAGHCVYTATGSVTGWNSRFIFFPGMVGSTAPYGGWKSSKPAVFSGYVRGAGGSGPGFPGLDYAFLKLNTRNRQSIGNVTGWLGVAWNSPETAFRSMGYPAEGWFATHGHGLYQWFTEANLGATWRWGATNYYEEEIPNRANGGASGGPWLTDSSGFTQISSVNSMCARGPAPNLLCSTMDGPYFNGRVKTLMDYANTL